MKIIAVEQRVMEETRYQEVRDVLDQRWSVFLNACGFIAMLLPNNPDNAEQLLSQVSVAGILLTGGGSHPSRDATDERLLAIAQQRNLPVMGVCHGMQVMQRASGLTLEHVQGHVTASQTIKVHGKAETVNSYHDWGTRQSAPELEIWAIADDGVVKAVKHKTHKWLGMMWHPERIEPFRVEDINCFKEWFV